jgi:hypothetical protein
LISGLGGAAGYGTSDGVNEARLRYLSWTVAGNELGAGNSFSPDVSRSEIRCRVDGVAVRCELVDLPVTDEDRQRIDALQPAAAPEVPEIGAM